MTTPRAILDHHISEAAFMQQIIDLATMQGWLVAHVPDALYRMAARQGKGYAMAGAKGLPDLILCHPTEPQPICFLEVKTETGRIRPEQKQWIAALDMGPAMYDYVVARVVRPSDWPWIESLLTGGDDWKEEHTT